MSKLATVFSGATFSIALTILLIVGMGGHDTSETKPHRNNACVVAKMLNRENPVFEELTTGWGFTPDTCLVQSATKQGDVRVPTSLVWCSVGVGQPVCLTLWPSDKK